MSEKTKIDWCDSTINFWSGCEKVSPGCTNCYITSTPPFRIKKRKHGDDPVIHEPAFTLARRLNKKPWVCDECGHSQIFMINPTGCEECNGKTHRRRVFALSLSDFLWDRAPVPVLTRALDTMRMCDQVDWLLCTKRSEDFSKRTSSVITHCQKTQTYPELLGWLMAWNGYRRAPKHIWVGTTIEDKPRMSRIDNLLKIPAAVRFLSCEPLLEDIAPLPLDGIDWVIPGGEAGRGARACNIQWVRNLKDQCAAAKVACFVKQMGSRPVIDIHDARGHYAGCEGVEFKHPKGGNMDEWPEDLRVRQWPESSRR